MDKVEHDSHCEQRGRWIWVECQCAERARAMRAWVKARG